MSNFPIITLLETVLGKGRISTNDNVAFNCPFCHHHKKKLEVNITSQHWHCWVCNAAGRKLPLLLRRLNVDRTKISQLTVMLEDVEYKPKTTTTNTPVLSLPEGFKPLWILNTNSPDFRNAIHYLRGRGITIYDILKYRIGYCEAGEYAGKIIIPSYDAAGQLNYFVSRAFYKADTQKHKNPKVSKDIIGFDLTINWSQPIVLCEGSFDAIAVKRNAIPLFGKIIQPALQKKIIQERVRDIYICLDADALKNAISIAERFMAEGLNVYFVELQNQDAAELGFERITEIIENTDVLTFERLMQLKMGLIWT